MNRRLIVLICAIALTGACGGKSKKASEPMAKQPAPAPASNAITANDLAGTWQLTNSDRSSGGIVTIQAIDESNVNVMAGGAGASLSGKYLVKGPHLLILTYDPKLKPLAWQIIDRDALLLTRGPEGDDTMMPLKGSSLTRAGSGAAAPTPAPVAPAPVAAPAPTPTPPPSAPAPVAAPTPPPPAPSAPAPVAEPTPAPSAPSAPAPIAEPTPAPSVPPAPPPSAPAPAPIPEPSTGAPAVPPPPPPPPPAPTR